MNASIVSVSGWVSEDFAHVGKATSDRGGCGTAATEWERLHVGWVAGADATLEVWLRHAATVEALPSATFERVLLLPSDQLPLDLELPMGGAVEVRLELRANARDGAVRVERVGVEWSCGGFG